MPRKTNVDLNNERKIIYATFTLLGGVIGGLARFLLHNSKEVIANQDSFGLLNKAFSFHHVSVLQGTTLPLPVPRNLLGFVLLGSGVGLVTAVLLEVSVRFIVLILQASVRIGLIKEDPAIEDLKKLKKEMKKFVKEIEKLKQQTNQSLQPLYKTQLAKNIDEKVKKIKLENQSELENYLCPITKEVLREPVRAADNFYYERWALQVWYNKGNKICPFDSKKLLQNPDELQVEEGVQKKVLLVLETNNSYSHYFNIFSKFFSNIKNQITLQPKPLVPLQNIQAEPTVHEAVSSVEANNASLQNHAGFFNRNKITPTVVLGATMAVGIASIGLRKCFSESS